MEYPLNWSEWARKPTKAPQKPPTLRFWTSQVFFPSLAVFLGLEVVLCVCFRELFFLFDIKKKYEHEQHKDNYKDVIKSQQKQNKNCRVEMEC